MTLQRLRAKRKRAVDALPSQAPPEWEDTEEPSVTRYVEGHDGRVSIEGLGPDVAEVVKAYKQKRPSLYARMQNSVAPVSKRMNTKGGKRAAIGTGIVAVLGGLAALVKALADAGVFKGGP